MRNHALLVATACCTLLATVMGDGAHNEGIETVSAKLPQNLENNPRAIRAANGENRRSIVGPIRTDDCNHFRGRKLPKRCLDKWFNDDIPAQHRIPETDAPDSPRATRASYGENRRFRPRPDIKHDCDLPLRGRKLPKHCLDDSPKNDIPAQHRITETDAPTKAPSTIKEVVPQPREDVRFQSSSFWKRDPSLLSPECNPILGFKLPKHCNPPTPVYRKSQSPPISKREANPYQDRPYNPVKGNPSNFRAVPFTSVSAQNVYGGFRAPDSKSSWRKGRPTLLDQPTSSYFDSDNQRRIRSVQAASSPVPSSFAPAPADAEDDDVYVPFSGQRLDMFDWQLVRELDHFARSNAVVSPVGVKLVLGMLHEASSRASAAELRTALGLPAGHVTARNVFRQILQTLQEKQNGFILKVGNKVYLDKSFEPRKNTANIYKSFYSADIERVDFTSPKIVKPIINEWVSSLTNGLIKNLITNDLQIANLITMVLNVIYFKGDWLYPFAKQSTTKGPFDVSPGRTVNVDYMKLSKDLYYSESQALDAKMLRLPYKGKKYSMFLILPNKKENFKQMIQLVTPALVREQLHSLQKLEVKVKLPKFVFHYTVHLKELLLKLGISRIFTQSDEINLTTNKTNIMISKVIQKVGLEVNEEGTEAASATEVDLVNHFGGGQKMFFATHPFLFFVEEEKTGTVVFVGKVMDPTNTPIKPLQPFPRTPTMGNMNIFKTDSSESMQKKIINFPYQ